MSGYDSVNRNVLSQVRKVLGEGADVIRHPNTHPVTANSKLTIVNGTYTDKHNSLNLNN